MKHFRRNSVFIGIYDDIKEDSGVFNDEICSFLGIKSNNDIRLDIQVNSGIEVNLPNIYRSYLKDLFNEQLIKLIELLMEYKEVIYKWLK